MLIIFALVFGGGFGGWGNRGGSPVTEADLCNANSFSELKGQVGRMNDQQAAIARQTDNGICQLGYQTLEQSNSIMQQIANCCCTTQRAVDSVKFDMANYASASNANTAAWGQKILDKLCEDKAERLQARIQQLELQRAMCGVVRYPTQTTFAAQNPFCCGGGFNI